MKTKPQELQFFDTLLVYSVLVIEHIIIKTLTQYLCSHGTQILLWFLIYPHEGFRFRQNMEKGRKLLGPQKATRLMSS